MDAASRTAFRGLRREAAVSLAKRDFHVDEPEWTPPALEAGAKLERYLGKDALAEKLAGGGHAVLSSTIPLRVNDGSGLAPVSLTLRDEGEAYVPANPLTPVAISSHASGGIALPNGLSVAPLSTAGAEAPVVVGNRVLYANASRDTDLMEEPRPSGAAIAWQLRSQESPQDQAVAFRLAPGEALRWSESLPGAVEVVEGAKTLIVVPPALAEGADGSSVPTSYSISGNVLSTHVDLSGSVDFPVLVDPEFNLFYGHWGASGEAHVWSGWHSYETASGFGVEENKSWIKIGTNPGAAIGSYGELYIDAPGPQGKSGSAGITRVDLTGVQHGTAGQSRLVARISGSNGSEPIWSYDGYEWKDSRPQPLLEEGTLTNQPIAFCAMQGGKEGHDGSTPPESPLCDEELNQGTAFALFDEILTTQTAYNWVLMEGAQVTYREPAGPNSVVLNHPGYEEGQWLKTGPTNWTVTAEDEGLGIKELRVAIPAGHPPTAWQSMSCTSTNGIEGAGFSGCPNSVTSEPLNLSKVEENGELSVQPIAESPAKWVNQEPKNRVSLFLDKEPPVISLLEGSLAEASGGVIGSGNYVLNFRAENGSSQNGSTVRDGVYSLEVKVDGKLADTVTTTCPKPKGRPSGGCYALVGSWTMNGQAYGAGTHTITVVAKDWLGNEASKSFNVTVNEAAYEPLGPGAVNLETGDFKLSATDFSISGGDASLSLTRTYDSRKLMQGSSGPLGPQWLLSLPDTPADGSWQSLSPLANGSGIAVYGANGNEIVFTSNGKGGYSSPAGYQADTLSEPSTNPVEYQITDAQGDYTRFKQPEAGAPFVPSKVAQATALGTGGLGVDKVSYSFATKEGITEPTQVLAPEPSEGACTAKLVQGCRALTFSYATSTKAEGGGSIGEAPSEWGEYKGRLSTVYFTAWERVKGEMSEPIAVAHYLWDKQGRLRAEWDPRLSTPLKTLYGWDSEDHVTAVSPPGHEPWLLHYGTDASDSSTGRLLSVSRFNAQTSLWKGEALENTAVPTLSSSSPVVGTSLSVSNGTWSTTTVAFGYQWERCNAEGGECAAIAGATNQSYTPLVADAGHKLFAQVTATNASGSVSAVSVDSEVIAPEAPVFSTSFGSAGTGAGQFKQPYAIAIAPTGNLWVADTRNERLQLLSPTGTLIQAQGFGVSNGEDKSEYCTSTCQAGIAGSKQGQFYIPEGIAVNQEGEVYVADTGNSRIQDFSASGAFETEWGKTGSEDGEFKVPTGVAIGSPNSPEWVVDSKNNRIEEFGHRGGFSTVFGEKGTKAGQFETPIGVALAGGHVYVTDSGNNRVQEFTTTGGWIREFGNTGSEAEKLSDPTAIATDPANGDLYVSSTHESRIKAYTPEGKYLDEFGHPGGEGEDLDEPLGLAISATGTIYVADTFNSRIDVWTPGGPTQEPVQPPPNPGTTAVSTIDYQVPVSGTGAPHALGAKEDEAWAQTKDVPAEATAIFPPTEPQGWPAGEYKRASIFYMDSANRTVNTASPSGAISTIEYNKTSNNVERTLTPDNRERALKEGSKSAEVAQLLSTQSTYNPEGTELTSTLGPQHTVRFASGAEKMARRHTQFFYEEGAPSGGPYDLVTKTVEGAEVTGAEEEVRTVKTSYSGQENLGWKLRAPTSTETSTGTQTLLSKTSYEASTGEVTETQTPAAAGGTSTVPPVHAAQFGSKGTEAGQLEEPDYDAIDAHGDVWVVEYKNDRLSEFSSSGAFIETVGWGVGSKKESKLEVCTSSCKAGTAGTGNGQFYAPAGIAIAGGDIYVVDSGNDRIEEFNEKNEYVTKWGTEGTGANQFKIPLAIAISPSGDVWVGDSTNRRLQEFSSSGTFIEALGWGVGSKGESKLEVCTSSCKAGLKGSGNGEFASVWGMTFDGSNLYVADTGNDRIEEFNEKNEYVSQFGSSGAGSGYLEAPIGIAVSPTTGILYVTDTGNNRVEEFTASGTYLTQFGSPGSGTAQLDFPEGVAVTSSGDIYIADDLNSRIQEWEPGNLGGHDTQTIYYTTEPNSTYPNCGKHPEWAGLPCQAQPATQPEAGIPPNLPVTTYTYNIWFEPATTTDTVGLTYRTTKIEYDAAGRPVTTAISASSKSVDKEVPPVTDEYNTETGALAKQSDTSEGKAESITIEENRLGQPTSYTDAEGTVTKLEYETEKEYRLTQVVNGEGTPAASTQTFGYETITGELASVKDSAAGTFTATRDVEGNITTVGYPNGMNANYAYNQVDEPITLEYLKTTHCSSNCSWYNDTVAPSIRGQWLTQTSTFSKENYRYDEVERLDEVQETPTGKGCTARLYGLEEDGNRTSLTTRESSTEKCPTEGGGTQHNTFDTSDQLDETGVSYEAFGNITGLPAEDAGGTALTSSFYINNMLATQEQNGEKLSYNRDPNGRILETIATGTTKSTVKSHYAGPGDSPAWTITSTGSWTRYITGIDGALAIQTNGSTPMLQLVNLHGDVVGEASISETESKLIPTNETTEYGVPRTTVSAKYSWLGADQVPTELPTGIINMGARTYIPQLGRFEQPDPQPGGSINAYAYTDDDPVNQADPSGEWTYNYENAEAGAAPEGLPGMYSAPGAIHPPPANLQAQAEFAADPPWDAVLTFTITLGGGGSKAYAAKSIGARLKKGFEVFGRIVGDTIESAAQAVRTRATQLWDAVTSPIFASVFACVEGADELAGALEAENWEEFPEFTATVSLVGCKLGMQGEEFGGTAKTTHF